MQTFLANQCRQQIVSRSLIAVFHNEGLTIEEMTTMKRRLRKVDIFLKLYGNKVVLEALAGTHLANMEPLLVGDNIIAVSDEPVVKELLKATKRIPKIYLLGKT